MATQSGIGPSKELEDAWSAALADPSIRLVKIGIQNESLVPLGSFPTLSSASSSSTSTGGDEDEQAFEKDFELFEKEGVVEDKVPAYYLLRLPSPTPLFLLYTFVPDFSPIRLKLLTASTTSTLIRSLSSTRLRSPHIHATTRDELTYAAWEAQKKHEGAERPRTEREEEVERIKRAEMEEKHEEGGGGGGGGRSAIFVAMQGGGEEGKKDTRGVLPWSEEAKEAVRGLGKAQGEEGARDVVQLEIDVPNETVVLSPSQPDSLSLPPSSPCYFFYRHLSVGIVLIYSCPPSSPIKSRLLYSSAALVLYKVAAPEFAGVKVVKKLETDDPTEVTPEWIDSELGLLAHPAAPSTAEGEGGEGGEGGGSTPASTRSGTSTPLPEEDKPKFARPVRPGRRR
ncbi:hypothetical protein JCM8547_000915 [Rhodosporidiobolus lusitaniae]